jgi:predicted transcriptional regulator
LDFLDEKVDVLNKLGLTTLQAKVYWILCRLGQATIRTISRSGQLDRAEVYRAVYELQEKGLVEKMVTNPIRFMPIPPSEGLKILLKRKTKEYKEIETKTKNLVQKVEKGEEKETQGEEGCQFLFIPKDEAMWRHFLKRYETVRANFDAILPVETLNLLMSEDLIFNKSFEKGVTLRLLTCDAEDNGHLLENISKIIGKGSFEVRYISGSRVRPFRILDKKEVFIGTQKNFKINCLKHPANVWSSNENIVAIFQDYFDYLWQTAAKSMRTPMFLKNSEMLTRESYIQTATKKMTPNEDLFPPILHSNEFQQPVQLSTQINTAGNEDSAFVTFDGKTLYFYFTPDPNASQERQLIDGITGTYFSQLKDNEWSATKMISLQEPGQLALNIPQFIHNNIMWFASIREGYVGVNLFTAELMNEKWTNWQYVGDRLMKDFQVNEAHLETNGKLMYFHSGRSGGKGGMDIWSTEKVDDEWQNPENLSEINTPDNEGWPFITQNGKELWFTRICKGIPAIFRSVRSGEIWGDPELVISQFASQPSLDNDGNIYFTHQFCDSSMKVIETDIYVARRN